jgi:hypothetical protein
MMKTIISEGIATMFRQQVNFRAALLMIAPLLVAGLAWTNTSHAGPIGPSVLLSSLLQQGASLTAGDKTFTNFTYTFTGDMPGSANVNVVPWQDDLGNFGIRIQGGFIDLPSSQGASDALITYTVTAGDGWLISDAHLAGNPNLLGPTGSISVTETFLPLGQNDEFTMTIYDDEGNPVPKLMDEVVFATPTKSLNVQKDILAIVPTTGSSATMSFVDQTFSQIRVPEPATVGMLILAGIGSVGWRRRRSESR